MRIRNGKLPLITLGVAVMAIAVAVVVALRSSGDHGPYAAASEHEYVLAAVGDIACEPDDAQNGATPAALKCGSPSLGGYDAEFATAKQAAGFHPSAVALLGDEQYEVGKLSDFEASFDRAWGGLKPLERPAPGNHEFYGYAKDGDHEAAQDGVGYFGYFNGHEQNGTPTSQGLAGDDTAGEQGWYSYNLGQWHIVSLNVECKSTPFNHDCSTTDGGLLAQETTWLANDLKNNHSSCTLAYWHQPTFSAAITPTAAVPASAPGAGGPEGAAADAWWQLLYDNHATLVLNGHEHAYARLRPMNPTGSSDPEHGIPEFIVGTGGESLDKLPGLGTPRSNPNVVTEYDEGYGVLKLTLKPNGYTWNYQPALAGTAFGASAMTYRDSGTGSCRR